MKAEALGVASPTGSQPNPPAAGTAPKEAPVEAGKGTATPEKGAGTPEGTGAGAGKPQGQQPGGDKRYDDLMSKWQKAEAAKARAEAERDLYKSRQDPKGEAKPPRYRDANWVPKDYNDLRDAILEAEEQGYGRAKEVLTASERSKMEAEQTLDTFIEEIKLADAEFDEDAFYDFASRHKFPLRDDGDLKAVYSSYREMVEAEKRGEERAKANAGTRNEPVNKPGAGAGTPAKVPYKEIEAAGSVFEAARNAYYKQK